MTLFTPIRRAEDLPRATTTTSLAETQTIDFKGAYAKTDRHGEMAKDVAAFANALGGAIVIGASADSAELAYPGLPKDIAERNAADFEEALARHLSPKPTFERNLFPSPDASSRFVLVVNVQPFADQIVGARVGPQVWRFPMRVGVDTNYLEPAMLPLYTSAVRRNYILLSNIDVSKDTLRLCVRNPRRTASAVPEYHVAHLQGLDLARNVVIVRLNTDAKHLHQIPFDDVDAVWDSGSQVSRAWVVRLLGYFEDALGKTVYHSQPSNTTIALRAGG